MDSELSMTGCKVRGESVVRSSIRKNGLRVSDYLFAIKVAASEQYQLIYTSFYQRAVGKECVANRYKLPHSYVTAWHYSNKRG
jgi:hypothetical protein